MYSRRCRVGHNGIVVRYYGAERGWGLLSTYRYGGIRYMHAPPSVAVTAPVHAHYNHRAASEDTGPYPRICPNHWQGSTAINGVKCASNRPDPVTCPRRSRSSKVKSSEVHLTPSSAVRGNVNFRRLRILFTSWTALLGWGRGPAYVF